MDNSTLPTVYYSLMFTQACTIGGLLLACNGGTNRTFLEWLPAVMSPFSALILGLLSIALLLTTVTGPAVRVKRIRRLSLAISIFCQVVSAILLARAFGIVPLDLDAMFKSFLPASTVELHTSLPMAFSLMTVSLSLIALQHRRRRYADNAQLFLLPILFSIILSVTALVFGVSTLSLGGQTITLSMLEVLALCFFMIAIIGSRPNDGLMVLMEDTSIPGLISQRLLFFGVSLPLILGFLSHIGHSLECYNTESSGSLMTAMSMLFIVISWVWAARKLSAIDVDYHHAGEEVSRLNYELEYQIKKTEELNSILTAASREAAQAHDQALDASRQKAQFFSNMSHEIRTPMNGVLGMVEILLRSDLSTEARQYSLMIREQGDSLLSVVNDILDFSKIETGRMLLDVTDFEPLHVVEDIAEIVSEDAIRREITLQTYVDPAVPNHLEGDASRLRQVLTNLSGRAIDRAGVTKVLVQCSLVEAFGDSACLLFSVVDDGDAMSDDEQAHLLHGQSEEEQSPSSPLSAGILGMSLSQRLVELMEGQLMWASSEDGTIFSFEITCRISRKTPTKSVSKEIEGLKVLVVDDDPSARQILDSYLTSWRMRCDVAPDAVTALGMLRTALLEDDPFRLAILDMRMPGMSGLELGSNIKKDDQFRDLSMILVTAYDDSSLGNDAIARGFHAYFTKPIRQSQLFDCIITTIGHALSAAAEAGEKLEAPSMVTSAAGDAVKQNPRASHGRLMQLVDKGRSESGSIDARSVKPPPPAITEPESEPELEPFDDDDLELPMIKFPKRGEARTSESKPVKSEALPETSGEENLLSELDDDMELPIVRFPRKGDTLKGATVRAEKVQPLSTGKSEPDDTVKAEKVPAPDSDLDLFGDDLPKVRLRKKSGDGGEKDSPTSPKIKTTSGMLSPEMERTLQNALRASSDDHLAEVLGDAVEKRVLIADDNAINRQVAQLMMQDLGFTVDLVDNGMVAVERFIDNRYDLILMDCQMPVMDGFEATKKIREYETDHADKGKVAIVALTADILDDTRSLCLASGMDDFLLKPIKPDKLKATSDKWVKSTMPKVAPPAAVAKQIAAASGKKNGEVAGAADRPSDERLLNVEALKKSFSEAEIAMLLGLVEESLGGEMKRLREAIAKGDDVEIAKAAHAFKGGSMSVEATSLHELLYELEKAGKAKEKEKYDSLFQRIEVTYDHTIDVVRRLMKSG